MKIGTAMGTGPTWFGTYRGLDPRLYGKTALVRHSAAIGKPGSLRSMVDRVVVQFDDISTGMGYGWRQFPSRHFVWLLVVGIAMFILGYMAGRKDS